jgi:vacuolar-type H+-ATPase subunit H
MTPLAELLDRLRRRRQPPGRAATAVGVPAAEPNVAAELAPLFGELEEMDAQASAIVASAQADAQRIERDGQREAQQIVEAAAREAQLEADRLRRERREAARHEAQAIISAAAAEAARLRQQAAARTAAVIDEVLGLVAKEAG